MSSKPTPGPYKVFDPNREGRSYRPIVVGRGDEHHWDEAFYIGNAARDINVIPLASLIADARNTLHETGLTPQQLRERVEHAEKRQQEAFALIETMRGNGAELREHMNQLLAAAKLAVGVIGANAARDALKAAISKVEGRS